MELFMPERVFFEPSSLNYPLGQEIYDYFSQRGIEIIKAPSSSVSRSIPGSTEKQKYARSKKTLVIAIKKSSKLDVCKPSADFEFSLVTNCPGSCEYCYLQTTQGYKPYLRTYVNLEDIFSNIRKKIDEGSGITTFEVASAGDPLALEHITGSLSKTIELFGSLEKGRLRVVTKFNNVDPLLALKHNGHTRFRVSVNSRYVIKNFEHSTSSFDERIEASSKLASAGYPIGFIVAPIMIYKGWKEEYQELFITLQKQVKPTETKEPVTFELIQHRFTPVAKKFIMERFPNTKLDMDESKRQLKWGKYGRFKYVYPKEEASEMKEFISTLITENFPDAKIEYFT
ncbi:MAG TPA: spore photoproduct lyase [Clostridia bacterium]|nr:spore photoproduct lyase [Clostridia bacterium]